MKVAIYGKRIPTERIPTLLHFCERLSTHGMEIWMHKKLQKALRLASNHPLFKYFDRSNKPLSKADVLISLGGDGTLLDAVAYVRDLGTPILGINTGRLGFLASVMPSELELAFDALTRQPLITQQRTALEISKPHVGEENFALNEVTLLKKDSSTMLTIHVEVDNEYLCNYWADGLIISTPTGSTAYSLSCGGPIVTPGSNNLIITPIAPHNLTVRPIVIPDHAPIKITVEGRENQFLMAMDSRTKTLPMGTEVVLQKAPFGVHLIQVAGESFFKTLRNKLMWGMDTRNE